MEVFKKTISAVFSNDRRYVVPLFQRPYVWTRENQWEPLWEDIRDRADLLVEQPQLETPPHFLGAIVIQQRPSWGDELLAHDVIDGQQRLTTFQVLLSAFRDHATTYEDKQVAAYVAGWTRNANPISNPEVEQFKLWPTSRDAEQFKTIAMGGSRAAVEAVYPPIFKRKRLQPRPRLIEAYLFFHEALGIWLREAGPDNVGERARVLRRVFDKHMQLVSIELEKQEDPQAIFETLNARGVPLLASDLLRNYMFQRAGGPAAAEKLHQKYWARFEIPDDASAPNGARFWEMEERQGRLNRARLDLFVQHYLSMMRMTEVLSGHLFPEYKAWIESARPFSSVDAELQEFARYAGHFFNLLRPTPKTALGEFALRMRALDNSTVYPLVLGLLGNPAISDPDRQRMFTDLESFLVRRLVCARPTKNYNRLFLQLLRDFNAGEATHAAFRFLLVSGSGEGVDWPDDVAFGQAWRTIDAYRELKPMRVEMLLRAIDREMTTALTEPITIDDRLTVEHLLPQDWHDHWPLPAGMDEELAAQAREEVVHDFGNLTLLTQPLNSSISNGPAKDKLPKIALNAALRLNSVFQGRTTWTESDIAARSSDLFEVARKVWPRPA